MSNYRTSEQIKDSVRALTSKNIESTRQAYDSGKISQAVYNKVMAALNRTAGNAK